MVPDATVGISYTVAANSLCSKATPQQYIKADVWVRADKSAPAHVMTGVSIRQHMRCVTMYIQLRGSYTLSVPTTSSSQQMLQVQRM